MAHLPGRGSANWLSVQLAIHLLGNLAAFRLWSYLKKLDSSYVHSMPWIFLIIPLAVWLVAAKSGLLAKTCRFSLYAIGMGVLSILTWLMVLYLYFTKVDLRVP